MGKTVVVKDQNEGKDSGGNRVYTEQNQGVLPRSGVVAVRDRRVGMNTTVPRIMIATKSTATVTTTAISNATATSNTIAIASMPQHVNTTTTTNKSQTTTTTTTTNAVPEDFFEGINFDDDLFAAVDAAFEARLATSIHPPPHEPSAIHRATKLLTSNRTPKPTFTGEIMCLNNDDDKDKDTATTDIPSEKKTPLSSWNDPHQNLKRVQTSTDEPSRRIDTRPVSQPHTIPDPTLPTVDTTTTATTDDYEDDFGDLHGRVPGHSGHSQQHQQYGELYA